MSAKGMDRSGAGNYFATVKHSSGNEVFTSRLHRNLFPVDDQGVAALDNDHVFVVVVCVFGGHCIFATCPKGHLTAVHAVEDITLDARRRLM
jgi:hypothetical protein